MMILFSVDGVAYLIGILCTVLMCIIVPLVTFSIAQERIIKTLEKDGPLTNYNRVRIYFNAFITALIIGSIVGLILGLVLFLSTYSSF